MRAELMKTSWANTMKTAIFLPAKGTSSRIPSKNMELMDGKPLFLHTLEKIAWSNAFDEVWLDTESDDIISAASHVDCNVLKRDPALASNATDGNKLFINEVKHVDADIIIQILGTSPFIRTETIKKAINILREDQNFDSVVLVYKQKFYTWADGRPAYDMHNIPNSNTLEDTTIETMGLYVVRREAALATGRRIGDRPYLLECSPTEAIDVNWPEDFVLANHIAAGMREADRRLLNNIKVHLSGSILSDVIDDLDIPQNQVLLGMHPNLPRKKVFGRAKTLHLRRMDEGDDFREIYTALNSYKTITPNDVIVVENEVPDYAYFGELNANLAIRSGAAGAIIGGKTRDSDAVGSLDFPTFSTGTVARDVRRRAVTASINQPISIFGTPVKPGELIFADQEAVVVFPRARETELLDEVFQRLRTENRILHDIAMGLDTKSLTENHGAF